MNRVFEIQIIQPNFDTLYKRYEQMFVSNQKKELGPVAIKIQGKLKDSRIEDNISMGTRLLEADEIENSSVRRNKTFLLNPSIEKLEIIGRDKIKQHGGKSKASIENKKEEENFLSKIFWKFIIPILVIVIAALLLYKFGIKKL